MVTHPSNSAQNPPTIEEEREVLLPAHLHDGTPHPARRTLLQLLAGNVSDTHWYCATFVPAPHVRDGGGPLGNDNLWSNYSDETKFTDKRLNKAVI